MLSLGSVKRVSALAMIAVLAAMPAVAAPTLDELLQRVGQDELSREKSDCRYSELTTVEELEDNGTVRGSELRKMDARQICHERSMSAARGSPHPPAPSPVRGRGGANLPLSRARGRPWG